MTLGLTPGDTDTEITFQAGLGKLLAHELAHLMGSEHDGTVPYKGGFFDSEDLVPCNKYKYLMAPFGEEKQKVWSNCTSRMVDFEFKKREEKQTNCLYT